MVFLYLVGERGGGRKRNYHEMQETDDDGRSNSE